MTQYRSRMRLSLSGRDMSTRLRNVLCNMADYRDAVHTWHELIAAYRQNPDGVVVQFLRTPGAGPKCLEELKALIEPELRGVSQQGDVVFLGGEDLQRIHDTIEEACGHCPESLCNDLRAIEAFFKASTIRTRLP